jgi:regulator of protease activity HflC (stomatin/prohibitin superfamily)
MKARNTKDLKTNLPKMHKTARKLIQKAKQEAQRRLDQAEKDIDLKLNSKRRNQTIH